MDVELRSDRYETTNPGLTMTRIRTAPPQSAESLIPTGPNSEASTTTLDSAISDSCQPNGKRAFTQLSIPSEAKIPQHPDAYKAEDAPDILDFATNSPHNPLVGSIVSTQARRPHRIRQKPAVPGRRQTRLSLANPGERFAPRASTAASGVHQWDPCAAVGVAG